MFATQELHVIPVIIKKHFSNSSSSSSLLSILTRSFFFFCLDKFSAELEFNAIRLRVLLSLEHPGWQDDEAAMLRELDAASFDADPVGSEI